MTDEDRELLLELRRLNDACDSYGAGVLYDSLSRKDQLAFGTTAGRHVALNQPIKVVYSWMNDHR